MAKDDKPKASGGPKGNEAIPMHKKLAMGQNPDTGAGSGKKTPA